MDADFNDDFRPHVHVDRTGAYTHVLARYPAHGPARRLTFAAIPTTFRLQLNGRH